MITRLYSVFDSVSGEYGPVFQAKNDDVALRNVIQMFTDMHVNIASLDCFHLLHVGDFDTETGSLVPVDSDDGEIRIDFGALEHVFDAYKAYCDAVRDSKENK